jgi:PilZ domain
VSTTGQRRFERYLTNLPITVSLGQRDIEGYCNQIAEGGVGALLQEPVPEGSLVSMQFVVPTHPTKLHLQGVVRYEFGFQHGLEFASLKEEERLAIRQFCTQLPSVSP